jgi:chromosome partitioning protein
MYSSENISKSLEARRSMSLRHDFSLRTVELRKLLGTNPSTLSEIYKRLGIQFADGDTVAHQGAAKQLYGAEVRKILASRGYEFATMAKTIAFMMCKGGVGKTTSTFFLAQRLSAYGAKVLAVDADAQGNLTSSFAVEKFGYEIDQETPILVDVLTDEVSLEDAIVEVTPSVHLVPSTPLNATMEGRIRERFKNPSTPVRKALEPVLDRYDYILIDCAPALNLTNTAIVSASDLIILPVAPDLYSQLGLDQTLHEVAQIEMDFNISIEKRIIFTKFDAREFTSLKYLSEIATMHREMRFSTAIRVCADVKNAVTKHEDLFALKRSNAREDYDSFALELMGLDTFFEKRRNGRAA